MSNNINNVLEVMNDVIDGCMGGDKAYCVATCPMHTDVKGYVGLIKENKGKQAIKLIRETLFLPGVLGRVCAHPCESMCKWSEQENPISIASLKRYAADNFDHHNDWDLTKENSNGKKVAIIGSGPAGAQAALDLVKLGFDVTIFEKNSVFGGMLSVGIPEYRLPRNIIQREYSYLEKLGVKFILNTEIGNDIEFSTLKAEYNAVVIAIGKHIGRIDMSLKNHDAKGVFSAAAFLKEASLTNNVIESGQKVLVVGGGDVAMDCVRVASRLENTIDVTSLCLESNSQNMAASSHEINGALEEGATVNFATAIKEIVVDDSNKITGVFTKKCITLFDEQGKFSPIFDENDSKFIEVDTIVFAIGQSCDNKLCGDLITINRDTTFECDELTLQSVSDEQVFIAGDASGHSVIVVQAMATGRRVATSVSRYLAEENLTEKRNLSDTKTYKTNLETNPDFNEKVDKSRFEMNQLDKADRFKNFNEVDLGLTKEQALRESDRCLKCECMLCVKDCLMLDEYTKYPKALFEEYLEEGVMNKDKIIAYSCNECSQCEIACPKDYDLKKVFMGLKKEYAANNSGFAAIKEHDVNEKMQILECHPNYCSTVPLVKKEEKKLKYVFIPGCTVPAYNPEAVEKVLEHLRDTLDSDLSAILRCCGKVTNMMGEEEKFKQRYDMVQAEIEAVDADVIITICPSCYMVYDKYSDRKVISYWELMQEKIGIPEFAKNIGEGSDVFFNVHDPCSTREVTKHHEAIRYVLDEMGYTVSEKERIGKNTKCCGVGGLSCTANPVLFDKVGRKCVEDCTSDHVVTYCGSCRGTLESNDKDALHILDLLFSNSTYMEADTTKRTRDDVVQGRLEAKQRFDKYNIKEK